MTVLGHLPLGQLLNGSKGNCPEWEFSGRKLFELEIFWVRFVCGGSFLFTTNFTWWNVFGWQTSWGGICQGSKYPLAQMFTRSNIG